MIELPEKKYDIIYLDPPWPENGGGKIKRGADRHYPLMKVKEIKALNIGDLAKENAHMYLWTTNNYLPDAIDCMKEWGFKYKTTVTWVKDRFGLGQYFRGQTEHCLFGVRGMIPYKSENDKRCQHPTVFHSPRLKHSSKPYKMKQVIQHVSDREGFDKIELFARNKTDGWDHWGNEV